MPLIGIFHADELPVPYSPVRLERIKKLTIPNLQRTKPPAQGLIVESWHQQPAEYLFKDIPFQAQSISAFIREHLTGDNRLADSFAAPISSAPLGAQGFGGISLTSIHSNYSFSREFQRTLQLMLPPTMRSLKPPAKAVQGWRSATPDGSEFHVAERVGKKTAVLQTLVTKQRQAAERMAASRRAFAGECSNVATLTSPETPLGNQWEAILKDALNHEIIVPQPLDALIESDIDLQRAQRQLSEDLMLQVVSVRQVAPTVTQEDHGNRLHLVSRSVATILDRESLLVSAQGIIQPLAAAVWANSTRLAQAKARLAGAASVDMIALARAEEEILLNVEQLLRDPTLKRERRLAIAGIRNKKDRLLQAFLSLREWVTFSEIWDNVKDSGRWHDEADLRIDLEHLHERGLVAQHPERGYFWTGRQ